MRRRRLFHALGSAAVAAIPGCAPSIGAGVAPVASAAPTARAARATLRGVCFDLFTLFDPRSVETVAATLVPDPKALCDAWRVRQFQYAFLRATADQYEDFRKITEDALIAAARTQRIELSAADRSRLVGAYSALEPWPDTVEVLAELRAAGMRMAPLANYAPSMLDPLLAHGKLERFFDARISTDAARTYKPDPRAYALGPTLLGLPKEAIAFSAFGGWDAAGARWFGFPTFWVNRLGVAEEELRPGPDASGTTLVELREFVRNWAT